MKIRLDCTQSLSSEDQHFVSESGVLHGRFCANYEKSKLLCMDFINTC